MLSGCCKGLLEGSVVVDVGVMRASSGRLVVGIDVRHCRVTVDVDSENNRY